MNPLLFAIAGAVVGLGALVWLKARNRDLRRRLRRVSAPLSGSAAVEAQAPEETIFRPTRRRTRFSGLWRLVEARFPLVEAPHALPRAVAAGLLAGVGFWLAMPVSSRRWGWWSRSAPVSLL